MDVGVPLAIDHLQIDWPMAQIPTRKITGQSVVIVGGGLAGLISAILLNRAGFEATLIEKKQYPFHRVCGEYISNEVLPFFKTLGINPSGLEPSKISRLRISSVSGKTFDSPLDLGGFGISRYILDNLLYQKASAEGVNFIFAKATQIEFAEGCFTIHLSNNQHFVADHLIGAYGKRSNLDKSRDFFYQRSPYIGVKYHIATDFPLDLVQLDNFEGGYCGTVKIEGNKYNLCYLSRNEHLKKLGSIEALEKEILYQNPNLKHVFNHSDFLYTKPEVINEISFSRKPLIENHILFCGDAAGMISPLCGNGMAMAIHSGKILAETIIEFQYAPRETLEAAYIFRWKQLFQRRLLAGRIAQKLFGSKLISEMAVASLSNIKPVSNFIMKQTHGDPF